VPVLGASLQQTTITLSVFTFLIHPLEFASPVIPLLRSTRALLQLLRSPTAFLLDCISTNVLSHLSFDGAVMCTAFDTRKVCFDTHIFHDFTGLDKLRRAFAAFLGTPRMTTAALRSVLVTRSPSFSRTESSSD
jgi:hypothetical protein